MQVAAAGDASISIVGASLIAAIPVAMFVAIAAFVIYALRRNAKHVAKLKTQNFDWYREQFPNLVKGSRVSCYRCEGAGISVERMMNQTYLRRHVCRTCGTALYYSPEQ